MTGRMFHLTAEFYQLLDLVCDPKVFEHLFHNFDRAHRELLKGP